METNLTLPAIDTRSDSDLKTIVQHIDPELEYTRDLHPSATTCRTLLVKYQGRQCTLKVRKLSNNVWDDMYFYYEINALHRAAERNISGVPDLIHEYKDDRFHAIIKTFIEGTPGNELDTDKLLKNAEFVQKLDALYLKLHLAGIAKIHFLPRKVVIRENGDLILVDLSTCIVNTESGIQLFVQAMRDDSRFITGLERHTTH